MVDPHVHLRDWNQANKETMIHAFGLAWRLGFTALFEMPNTDPPLTNPEAIERRLGDADRALDEVSVPLFHGLYGGLTADPRQVEQMVAVQADLFPRVVGLKLYAGHSTGAMGVTTAEEQLVLWQTLARCDYDGVVAVHCERENLLRPDLWDPDRPITHGAARPPLAEVASVQTQIDLAQAGGFRGSLHVCHVSHEDTVTLITRERNHLPFALRCGVTPHHLLLSEDVATKSEIAEWKVNPPLRSDQTRSRLEEALSSGAIDWIESDHAPHTLSDKRSGASGLPGLAAIPLLLGRLRALGIDDRRIRTLTQDNVLTAFGLSAERIDNPNDPTLPGAPEFDYATYSEEYEWDPYRLL
jgi:dihydroorotase